MNRKVLYRIFTIIATIAVFIVIGFLAIMIPANSKAFYHWQFTKHNTLDWVQSQASRMEELPDYDPKVGEYVENMNEQQLEDLMMHVIRYCMWLEDDINITVDGHYLKIFRDDETSHMKDVKNVFGEGIILTLVSILVCIAYLFFLFNRPKEYYETSRKVPFITLGVLIGVFLAVALYTIIDYKYVFEVLLHNALFSGNFSFSNGVMISMIGEIFPDLFMLIGIGWAVSLAVPVLAFVFYNRHLKKKLAQNEAKKTEKTETTTAN